MKQVLSFIVAGGALVLLMLAASPSEAEAQSSRGRQPRVIQRGSR